VLAMTFNHVVFDGTGAGKILELLARCCRDPSATPLPLTFEKENDVRSAIFGVPGNTYPVQDHRGGVGPAKAIPPVPPDAASLRTCRFEFNIERILRLKRQCAQLLKHGCIFQPGSADLPPFLSSNDVLTSALADAVQRARCNSKEARTYDWLDLCMAVNMRDRIELPIAREFLGNMAFNLRLTTPAPDHEPERCLDCRPTDDGPIPTSQLRFITELACQLRNKIRSMDRDYFHSLMTYVANQKDWSQTGMIFTDLAFTSWRHVDICGLDFGITFGSVHDFDLVFGLVDGAVIALPKRPPPDPKDQKDPNWDIHITLPAKDLEALVEDDLIRWLMGR
jgi:fumigaclavine B O-acetyltransferase